MTAVSFSMYRGLTDSLRQTDLTVGTAVPGAGDVEVRFNLLDQNSNPLTKKDVINALASFQRALESGAYFSNAPPL